MLTWTWVMSAVIAVSFASVHHSDSHEALKKGNVCTGGGYVYDPEDCQVFYKCLYSNKRGSYIPVKTICSPGTVFSKVHHNTCVPPKKSGRPECEHSRPGSIYSLRVKEDESPESADASAATKKDLVVCKKQGFLEDPEDCTKFYLCVVSGINIFKKYDYSCPPSTVWESQRRWCVVSWATSREECKTNDAPPETDESGSPAEMPFLPPPVFDDEDGAVDNPEVPEAGGQVTSVPESEKGSDDQSPSASAHVPAEHPSVLPLEQGNESGVEHPAEQAPDGESVNGQSGVPEGENKPDEHDPKAPEHENEPTNEQTEVPEQENAPGNQQPEVPEQGNESGESHVVSPGQQSESGAEKPEQGSESGEKQPEVSEPGNEAVEHEPDVTPMQENESGQQQHPDKDESHDQHSDAPGHESGEHRPDEVPTSEGESGEQNSGAPGHESGEHRPDKAPTSEGESGEKNSGAPGHESDEHRPDEAPTSEGESGQQNSGAPGHESESEKHHPDEAPAHKDESGGEHPEASGHENDSGDQHSEVPEQVTESGDQDGEAPVHNNAAGDQQPEVSERDNESGDQKPEVPEDGDGSHEQPSVSKHDNESDDQHSEVPEDENGSGDQQPEVPESENESVAEQRPESPVHKDESGDQQSEAPENPKVESVDEEPSEYNPAITEHGGDSNEQNPTIILEGGNESDEQASAVEPEHGNESDEDSNVLGHPGPLKPPKKCPDGPTNTVSTHCPIGQLTGNQVALVCPTGFRRHPRYCNLFYQCTSSSEYDYKVVVLSCPGNTCFDNGKMQCLPADKLTDPCGGVYVGTSLYRTLARHSLSPVDAPSHRLCPGVGHYPYEDGCSNLYYKCMANPDNTIDGYVYKCPQGYMYWAAARRCEEASRFDCSK